jgi:two-component system, CAI-1 autoinducer sensor kinase/phosphatase CqsS
MPKQNPTSQNSAQLQLLKSLSASIAHEAKTPLAGIKSACQIIKINLDQTMELIDLIGDSSSRGLLVIDVILQNIRDGKIDQSGFVDLSISEVLETTIASFLFENQKEKELLNINYDNDFVFKGDEVLMSFVILNLLRNALCYKAKIDIWFDGRCLYFKDSGVGIPADKLPHIFDDFFTSNKKGGTGLGLPFCRRVMKAFEGDISVKSETGKGTEFCLRFE